jgi:hypothetical protein
MQHEILDVLGRRLMSEYVNVLRKHAWSLLEGEEFAGASWYESQYGSLRTLDSAQRNSVERLLDDVIVSSCHAILEILDKDRFVDQSLEGRVSLKIVDKNGVEVDAASVSDGLSGELYGDRGWIERFGRNDKS